MAEPSAELRRAFAPLADRLTPLRCLAAVVRLGSASRAAEAVYLSQPAVTRAVRALETQCGVALFERGARGMAPTIPGQRAAARAQALLDHLDQGLRAALQTASSHVVRAAEPQRFAGAVSAASLKALVAVAACGTETAAAHWLGQTQPAVHRSLRTLEHMAGLVLLRRTLRGTRLLESGEALLHHVKLAFAEARAMQSELAAWRGEVRGRVVIGALPLSVTLFLPQAIDAVLTRHPEVEITVVDGTYESLMQQLSRADVDIIVGALRTGAEGVTQDVLFEEALAVVARPGHPCLQQPGLTLAQLLAWPWVVPLQDTPASYALQQVFAQAGLPPPSAALQANNAPFTRALVRTSDRLALTSLGQALADERDGQWCRVPVALPQTQRRIGIALRASGAPSPDVDAVLAALRRAAQDLRLQAD